ncbi:MAG: hypothetical protein CBARDMAM_6994, partial [uncultured Caballeronia sp.]
MTGGALFATFSIFWSVLTLLLASKPPSQLYANASRLRRGFRVFWWTGWAAVLYSGLLQPDSLRATMKSADSR